MEQLKIYIDRFKDDHKELLKEKLSPALFDIEDKDLHFPSPIEIEAEVYLANDHLVIHFDIETTATLPCSICNQPAHYPVSIKNLYLTKPLSEIQGVIYDLTDEVRESILLQIPPFAECNTGQCPERESVKKYFKPTTAPQQKGDTPHFPFADLDR